LLHADTTDLHVLVAFDACQTRMWSLALVSISIAVAFCMASTTTSVGTSKRLLHELDVLVDHTHVQTHKTAISLPSQPSLLQRQKTAKKNGPQLLDNEDDILDEAVDPAPPLHPPADPTQLAASQYPAGVPLPGQDPLSANRIAAFQAGVQQRTHDSQGQAAAVQAKKGKAAPQQAAPQEVTKPAVAASSKQGKKRGAKKQAQKVG